MMNVSHETEQNDLPGAASRRQHVDYVLKVVTTFKPGVSPAIIIFCGSRGCGKSTILEELRQKLAACPDVCLLGKWSFEEMQPPEVEAGIRAVWEGLPAGQTGVILIDHLDEPLRQDGHDEQILHKFEQEIMSEAVMRRNLMIVATSTEELRIWCDPDVRSQAHTIQLTPLQPEEVARAAEEHGLDGNRAMQISCGHPQVLAWWLAEPSLGEEEIARRAVEFFLAGMPAEDRQVALLAAAMPQLDSFIMLTALEDASQLAALEKVHMLMNAGLVHWEDTYGYYYFYDSSVRQLLARRLFYADPDKFDDTHRKASDYFKELARGAVYLERFLVGAVYHSAYAQRDLPTVRNGTAILTWLKKAGEYWLNANWAKVITAWETGAKESAVREEIIGLIGAEKFAAITTYLKHVQAEHMQALEE
jgi:ATPase family associated with various cellular activities (AAA)